MINARLRRLVQVIQEKKGENLIILDVRKLTWIADYFIILTGTSLIHTRTLAESILEKLKGTPCLVEGMESGSWIILDYHDIVVHIFLPETRDYYRLEKLWGDAKEVPLE
ncbi:MAG: ribosome silencing factor [Candidatus Omnitrophica bacterium]|nr:ribosome silencing factor [Candidatus Omnitrophota bacterium]MCM8769326.1 ribosome silencing factor [Candidatus Omnitrophota bacterium]